MKKKKLTASEELELKINRQKFSDLKPAQLAIVIKQLFTTREADVLRLFAKGKSRKVIASDLGITITTVDKHINKIHLKTGTHSVAELMKWIEKHQKPLRKQGLID